MLVALTDANRQSFYNPRHKSYANDPPWNRFVHSAWIHSGNGSDNDDWVKMVRQHMVLTDCPEVNRLNWQQTVWFFQGQKHIHSNIVFQFATLDIPMTLSSADTLLWPDRGLHSLLEKESDPSLFCEHGHPSESGHERITKQLIPYIDCAILAQ